MAGDDRSFTRDRGPDHATPRPDPDPRFPTRTAAVGGFRRLAAHKVLAAGALLLLAAAALLSGGRYLVTQGRDWLALQPAYLLPFRDIQLDPEPPAWIRSGRRGLLEQVQADAHWPETLSILSLDLERLAADFRRGSPWVKHVVRIARPDRTRLIVELDYRRPAAYLRLRNGRLIHVDADGVALPHDDIDPRGLPAAGLPRLVTVPDGWTAIPLAGLALRLEASDAQPESPANRAYDPRQGTLDAARLAGFLTRATLDAAGPDGRPPLPISAIHANADGLFVESEGHFIWWRPAARFQAIGEPTDPEKWAMLRKWLENNSIASISLPHLLGFDHDQVVVRKSKSP